MAERMLQNLNGAPDDRFQQLYENYPFTPYSAALIQSLSEVLTFYRDDACIDGFRNGDTLQDTICHLTGTFHPFPLTKAELQIDRQLVVGNRLNHGVYGDIYQKQFGGHNFIIKITRQNNNPDELLRETFFTFRIVNEFILRGMPNLVPTYGFVFCDKSQADTNRICRGIPAPERTGFPWIHLIQKNITDNITLNTALGLHILGDGVIIDGSAQNNPIYDRIGIITLPRLINILTRVFSVLVSMQESPFQIAHNDLHGSNIILSMDPYVKVHVIDWGQVSFNWEGVRYKGDQDSDYTIDQGLVSGANDMYFLLHTIYAASRNQEIKTWALHSLNTIFEHQLQVRDEFDTHTIWKVPLSNQPWLFRTLGETECGHDALHNYNMNYLQTLTYRRMCQLIGIPLFDYTAHLRAGMLPGHSGKKQRKSRKQKKRMNSRR
jgi:hypothetical protein